VLWVLNASEWQTYFVDNFLFSLSLWAIGLLLAGIVASLVTIRWSIFILYACIVASGTGFIFWLGLQDVISIFVPVYTIFISIIGFIFVEFYRRSHKYYISNQRITFKGGIVTKQERTLRYDKVTDINAKQGIIGQIFGFGTIIPISQSGFGLGSDKSFAGGGVALGEKKVKLFGLFGGGKEVQTPRARSYYELHGVYPYKEVKKLVEEMVQGNVITPYQQEQVAFQKEQVDIQKQMRDLLKMQSDSKSDQKGGEEGNDN
jgi:membrane protein YdbS with pleckstrin-like domain